MRNGSTRYPQMSKRSESAKLWRALAPVNFNLFTLTVPSGNEALK